MAEITTPVIDFHCHAGNWGRPSVNSDIDRYLRMMDEAGVDKSCLNCIWFGDARRGNDLVASFVSRHPDRFVQVAFVTPHHPDEAIEELDRCFGELNAKFLKIYPNYFGNEPNDSGNYPPEDFFPIFEWCSERGIVVMSHAYGRHLVLRPGWNIGLAAPRDNPGYTNLVDRFPGVKWMIGHKGGGSHQIPDAAIEAAKDLPNVYMETAARSAAAGAFEYVVETMGDDRVMYGSDVPLFDLRNEVGRIVTADISDESKRKILGLNTIELLGLEMR